ncbi:MAG: 23S rRNA (uracil(1939)-C(5))-methyltransferase RlmD [Ktedonobacterales bacterium]
MTRRHTPHARQLQTETPVGLRPTNSRTTARLSSDLEADDSAPEIEVELTDLAYGGDAVGRYQGRAIFVTGGLPGELVRARFTRERSNYARATLVEVLRSSASRVVPRYPELGESGGFQWQHLAYAAQLQWKTRIVRQLLMRVGHFSNPKVHPTLGMPAGADLWRYRTVAQFGIAADGAIGFRRSNSHVVLDMPFCPLVHPLLDEFYQGVRAWIRANWGASALDYALRFTLRCAGVAPASQFAGSESYGVTPRMPSVAPSGLLTIEACPGSAFGAKSNVHSIGDQLLSAVPGLAGVVVLGLPGGRGRMVIGQDFVYERLLDRTFRISAGSFFQVNPAQTPVLVREALAAMTPSPGDSALDGYSGAGLFSMFLANYVTEVYAIESQPSAVADARASAAMNRISNITTSEGVLERAIGSLRQRKQHVDIALVDPPRTGCHPRALAEIKQLGPRTLVYVSCDPSTLARDLHLFCTDGYRLVSVQPVDMFPFTSHVECVALCERSASL